MRRISLSKIPKAFTYKAEHKLEQVVSDLHLAKCSIIRRVSLGDAIDLCEQDDVHSRGGE